jgi:hypothetical protein
VALIVDAAREFRSIPDEAIRAIEETFSGIDGNYLRGVATVNERLVLLLNLEGVLRAVSPAAGLAQGAHVPSSAPLTPALSPLRGEGAEGPAAQHSTKAAHVSASAPLTPDLIGTSRPGLSSLRGEGEEARQFDSGQGRPLAGQTGQS